MTDQVILCWVEPGNVGGKFMDSVIRLFYEDRRRAELDLPELVAGHSFLESGPRIAAGRNDLVRSFLAKEAWKDVEWLLMLDADMVFDGSLVHTLLDGTRNEQGQIVRPVTGGLCFGGGHGSILPTMYRFVDPETNNGSAFALVSEWEPNEVVSVDATGAACLLIHRGILELMAQTFPEPSPWFAESEYKGQSFGEDWTFCMRIRNGLGFPIYVNTAAKVGHVKTIVMDETMYRTGMSGLKSITGFGAPEVIKEAAAKSQLILPTDPRNREQRRAVARVRA